MFWELALLRETGAGLDLTHCAVTGSTEDLRYVSPKTGRAVSGSGAGAWAPRLLSLPDFLQAGTAPGRDDLLRALELTGYFLHRNAVAHGRRALPPARGRLLDGLATRPPPAAPGQAARP